MSPRLNQNSGVIRFMKKFLIVLIMYLFQSQMADAQLWKLHRLEVSGGIGTTQFFGDIGGYSNETNILGLRDFTFKQTRFDINTSVRYRIAENFSARVSLISGWFHSTDARGSNITRGFESRTIFFEPTLIGEYYIIKNMEENSFLFLKDKENVLHSIFKSLDFYAFTGFGGLAYRVKPNDILSPHMTSSGGFTEVVPLGIGVSMFYSAKINFGVELGGRFTFSDNLDGYAAPKSSYNDVYHMFNFTITYKINTGKKEMAVVR